MNTVILIISLLVVFRIKNNLIRVLILSTLFLWSIEESVYGILQVIGVTESHNMAFVLTGHFDNPGPYGGFIAAIMAVGSSFLIKYRHHKGGLVLRILYFLAVGSVVMGFLVLPASMSRTAWVSFAISLTFCLLSDKGFSGRIRPYRRIGIIGMSVVLAVSGILMYELKRDSAIGRLHIWRIETMSIIEHPLGTGPGTALGTYGKTQEKYFRNHLEDVPDRVVRVAGCPEYPFNDYLGIAVEYGIPGLLFFLVLLGMALYQHVRNRSEYASGIISWMVFAFASYPLSVPQTSLLLILFIAAAMPSRRFAKRVSFAIPVITIVLLSSVFFFGAMDVEPLIDRSEYRTCYQEGYLLYMTDRPEESNEILSRGASVSSDPVFHVIMGRNFESLGDYRAAEQEYLTAHYMIPCRIYPLLRLARLKLATGDIQSAEELCNRIISMPVTTGHRTMQSLQNEAKSVLDSLNNGGISTRK